MASSRALRRHQAADPVASRPARPSRASTRLRSSGLQRAATSRGVVAAPYGICRRSARRGLIGLALKALVPELPDEPLEAEADDRCMSACHTPRSEVESAEGASAQLPASHAQACDAPSQFVQHSASGEAAPAPKSVRFAEEEVILVPNDYMEAVHQAEKDTRALDRRRAQEAWGPCLGPAAALAVGALHAIQGSQAEDRFAS